MADINSCVVFSADILTLIAEKLSDNGFSHECWGDESLLPLRQAVRNHYREVQLGKCSYCQNPVSLRSASNCHVEHIAPKSKYLNFIFEPKNLCVVCADCNEIKREQEVLNEVPDTIVNGEQRIQYPRSSNAFKVVHPHFDKYDEHIVIFNGYYVDLSIKGHFTIGACKLNRHLHEFGWEQNCINEDDISEQMNAYLESVDTIDRHRALDTLKRMLIRL
ncbi:HNH endonuclease [Aeromonas veronii]